ncbi:DUF3820 family protein [Rhodohalobacter sp. 8-1]|uniref:DUF3820 family protein n=1 Tax=Rhodohalobacter sp. 8-1 TaxID=3131972 RepID=UPI0030ECA018
MNDYKSHDGFDRNFLIQMVQFKMPFGQYVGRYVTDLPVHYLEWFQRQGFPSGKLGQYLATMYEIKTNGLDDVLKPIKYKYQRRF